MLPIRDCNPVSEELLTGCSGGILLQRTISLKLGRRRESVEMAKTAEESRD